MTKSVYVAAAQAQVGKGVIALGLIEALKSEGTVGLFRPLVNSVDRDQVTTDLLRITGIDQSFEDVVGATYEEIANNREGVMAALVAKFGSLRRRYDSIVVVGSGFTDVSDPVEVSLNARIAANLDTPVIVMVSGRDKNPAQIRRSAQYAIGEFRANYNQVIALIANRVEPEHVAEVTEQLSDFEGPLISVFPENEMLAAPTVRAQFDDLDAMVWKGTPAQLDRESMAVLVSGMTLQNLLGRLRDQATLIMASDRIDLLPGVLLSQTVDAFPKLAAIVLVGGYQIPPFIAEVIDNLNLDLAIGCTDLDSFNAATRLGTTEGIAMSTARKVEAIREANATHLDLAALLRRMGAPRRRVRTQHSFEYDVVQQARKQREHIVLPESSDARILTAASILREWNIVDLTLLGEEHEVQERANRLGLDIDGIRIQSYLDPEYLERYARTYAELRAHKGITLDQARIQMADATYFGTMMVYLGDADAMVSGAIHTTADTIRPAFEIIKTKPGVSVASSAYFMCLPDRLVIFADCAVNPNPNPSQLADIAISSAETAAAFGIEPRVAMLSYSTGMSGKGPDVDMVREAVSLAQERAPEVLIDGPIQFDAAIDQVVADLKMPGSAVAGQASVYVFPDLQSGNICAKAVQRTSGAVAVGPLFQGLNKTITDLSRGAMVDDIVSTIAITAVQAQGS